DLGLVSGHSEEQNTLAGGGGKWFGVCRFSAGFHGNASRLRVGEFRLRTNYRQETLSRTRVAQSPPNRCIFSFGLRLLPKKGRKVHVSIGKDDPELCDRR